MRFYILPEEMTTAQRRQIALDMTVEAARMLRRRNRFDPEVWREMLRDIGVQCIRWPLCRPTDVAVFVPDWDESSTHPHGIVMYNFALEPRRRAAGLCHEFGHALLHQWVTSRLYDTDVVCSYSYNDDGHNVRHKIARQFERQIMQPR